MDFAYDAKTEGLRKELSAFVDERDASRVSDQPECRAVCNACVHD